MVVDASAHVECPFRILRKLEKNVLPNAHLFPIVSVKILQWLLLRMLLCNRMPMVLVCR